MREWDPNGIQESYCTVQGADTVVFHIYPSPVGRYICYCYRLSVGRHRGDVRHGHLSFFLYPLSTHGHLSQSAYHIIRGTCLKVRALSASEWTDCCYTISAGAVTPRYLSLGRSWGTLFTGKEYQWLVSGCDVRSCNIIRL